LKGLNESGSSVVAFAAAETGIEWALLNAPDYAACINAGVCGATGICPSVNIGAASYTVTCTICGSASEYLCVTSIGVYHGTRRAIKIQR
jgi:hypothetical protein